MTKMKEKILLALLPFWTPQIPPLGIACLKGFLQEHGYPVTVVDANIEEEFKNAANMYFDTLKEYVPEHKRGNFYSVGQDVFRNHMMAHLNYDRESRYMELVGILVYKTFFVNLDEAAVLRLHEIIDEFYDRFEAYFTCLLAREKPDILGLSVYEGTAAASVFAFKLAREQYPGIKTIMGGGIFANQLSVGSPNFEYFLEKNPFIDTFIVGEGENLLLKLLEGQLPGSQRVYGIKDIQGEVLDLSTVDIPDFADFTLDRYPYLASYTSRSCPFQCSFCSETLQWGKYRKKKAGQIVNELMQLYRKYNRQLFLLGDSLLNPVITDLARELLKENLSIYWDGYLRADDSVGDLNNTQLWRRAGFYRARLGIESGSPRVLELMEKKITPAQIKEAVYSLAYAGIKTTTYWVVGYPGETEEDFQYTLDLLSELKDYIYEAWCSPFYYYLTGQVKSKQWEKNSVLLYPESAREMLMVQTWVLDREPSGEEAHRRMNRFTRHCRRLGIPNPYSSIEFYQADVRWRKLHKNAVPSIVEFGNGETYISENKTIKKLVAVRGKRTGEIEFDF